MAALGSRDRPENLLQAPEKMESAPERHAGETRWVAFTGPPAQGDASG